MNMKVPMEPPDNTMTLVHHFLERSARLFPQKIGFIHGPVRAAYSEINNRANNLARYLTSKGIGKGDRVALLMENSVEYIVSYYGIMKAGAVASPLNTDLKPEGLRYVMKDLEARVLIASSRFDKVTEASDLAALGVSETIVKSPDPSRRPSKEDPRSFDSIASPNPRDNPEVPGEEADLASIVYTSGSTGGPKGVMLTHRNIVDNTFSICRYLRLTEHDVQMCVLPFFYVMGKSLLNTHVAVGGTVVINNQSAFPAAVLKDMITQNVTGFSGVPSTFAYLLHRSPLAASRDKLASLRYVSQAGGHMARALKEKLRTALPAHTEIVIMYGATEGSARLSYLEPQRFLEKMESIGTAIPGVVLRVLREDGSEAAVGEVGELVAAGSNIMRGYWRNPEETARVLKNGWYHTGDQAYQDDEGFLFIVGRKDDLIKVGGHKVNPQEIEDTLMGSGMFVEAMVLGLPDELLGKRLAILGVPADHTVSSQAVMAYCAERLPRFMIPGEVRFTKALPKKPSGKMDREGSLALFNSLAPDGSTDRAKADGQRYAQPPEKGFADPPRNN